MDDADLSGWRDMHIINDSDGHSPTALSDREAQGHDQHKPLAHDDSLETQIQHCKGVAVDDDDDGGDDELEPASDDNLPILVQRRASPRSQQSASESLADGREAISGTKSSCGDITASSDDDATRRRLVKKARRNKRD